MTATEYILILLGSQPEGQMQINALHEKLQYYGIPQDQVQAGMKECISKHYLIESGDTYRLTRLGAGMYKVVSVDMPAWPRNDVRMNNKAPELRHLLIGVVVILIILFLVWQFS